MKISVITTTFNSESTLEDTLKSVQSQDYQEIEHIVVDGGSSDKTLDIVEKYRGRISKFVSGPDKGIYDAMNKGLALATGEVIGFLNSDDVYAGNSVLRLIAAKFQETGADAVYADLTYVTKDLSRLVRYWNAGPYHDGAFLKGWMPPHPTFYVRSEVYKKLGGFNISLKSSADYELMLRFVHKEKIKTAYLQEVVVKMRTGGQSNASIKNRVKANREDRLAWKINGLSPNLFTLYLKPLKKLRQYLYFGRANKG